MLTSAIALHAGVSMANRKSNRSTCTGASTIPVDEATRQQATFAVLCLVNRLRARYGLGRVHASFGLTVAATQHSADMVRRAYFAHDAPDGETLDMRARHSGYVRPNHKYALSEAIAWGTNVTPRVLVRLLRNSAVHRRILLDRDQRDIGVGLSLGAPTRGVATASATLVLAFGY